MIRHNQFVKLRLAQFLPATDIDTVTNFEYMGKVWVGETSGFTEWLRHGPSNRLLGSLTLSLKSLQPNICSAIFHALELPLSPGMTVPQIKKILGKPKDIDIFASDRKTYNFVYAQPDPYLISCTVLKCGGLIHLEVMVPGAGAES